MEAFLSCAASCADPESNRRYRHTWGPDTLPRVAALCPCVVYGRVENRIRDLERGGDGFGVPYCNLNGRCFCGAFQFCCCCLCCCGYAEILVLQRDMARIWGYPGPESEADDHAACRRPWRFLAETEAGLHAALSARDRTHHMHATPYRPEPPMRAQPPPLRPRRRSTAIPPDGPPSPRSSPAPLFDPPIALGHPSGPLAILPGQYPRLYDIEEREAEGGSRGRSRAGSASLSAGDAAADAWRRAVPRGSGLGECWAGREGRRSWGRTGMGAPSVAGPSRPRGAGPAQGARRRERGIHAEAERARQEPSQRVPSRIIIEGSESNVVADSGNLDGGGDAAGSMRIRSVRVRMGISRESAAEPAGEGEGEGI